MVTAVQIINGDSAKIEEILHKAEPGADRLQTEAAAWPTLVAYVDTRQCYRFSNQSSVKWFNLSSRELRGRHLKDILGNEVYAAVRPYIEAALAGRAVDFEQVLPRPDTGDRHVAVNHIPDSTATGEIKGFFVIMRDVTAHQQHEEEQRRRLTALSQAARLMTMDRMATEIAHEINQPLTAIANYSAACLRALQNEQPVTKVMGWLEQVNVQAKRASQIVQQLRAFIRKGKLPPVVVDIDRLVGEVIDCTAVEARAHGIAVSVQPSDESCRVVADRMLIEQVILNLIRNAMEALDGMDSAQRRLCIKVTRGTETIAISVCDNGPGIPPELGERIFEPFVTSRREGLGMGLAICRSIVEAYGGALTVTSTPGEGATFTFTLPMTGEEEHA
ncbi:MAG: ATP-binding protein [Candidatus Competibacteraceae bacterium]